MVATMRCSAMGINILPAYNEFVRTNRSTIQSANGLIKAQFSASYGGGGGVTEYDRFTTRLANAYGADPTNAAICERTASLAHLAVDANGDIGKLLQVAESMGRTPDLPGGECQITFAEAR